MTCIQKAIEAAEANVGAIKVLAIGITNQRETTVIWDAKTGQPLHNAVAWPDGRTAAICRRYAKKLSGPVSPFLPLTIAVFFAWTSPSTCTDAFQVRKLEDLSAACVMACRSRTPLLAATDMSSLLTCALIQCKHWQQAYPCMLCLATMYSQDDYLPSLTVNKMSGRVLHQSLDRYC